MVEMVAEEAIIGIARLLPITYAGTPVDT